LNYTAGEDHTTGETHKTVLSKGLSSQRSLATPLTDNVPLWID